MRVLKVAVSAASLSLWSRARWVTATSCGALQLGGSSCWPLRFCHMWNGRWACSVSARGALPVLASFLLASRIFLGHHGSSATRWYFVTALNLSAGFSLRTPPSG